LLKYPIYGIVIKSKDYLLATGGGQLLATGGGQLLAIDKKAKIKNTNLFFNTATLL